MNVEWNGGRANLPRKLKISTENVKTRKSNVLDKENNILIVYKNQKRTIRESEFRKWIKIFTFHQPNNSLTDAKNVLLIRKKILAFNIYIYIYIYIYI